MPVCESVVVGRLCSSIVEGVLWQLRCIGEEIMKYGSKGV